MLFRTLLTKVRKYMPAKLVRIGAKRPHQSVKYIDAYCTLLYYKLNNYNFFCFVQKVRVNLIPNFPNI